MLEGVAACARDADVPRVKCVGRGPLVDAVESVQGDHHARKGVLSVVHGVFGSALEGCIESPK